MSRALQLLLAALLLLALLALAGHRQAIAAPAGERDLDLPTMGNPSMRSIPWTEAT